jgi:inhibitor of KinA sporulation pathway (predicted exonuclease)
MALPNIFTPEVTETLIQRINQLTPETQAKWGKMNVSQMLAHCNVTYEMAFEDKHPKPNVMMRFVLKLLVKPTVTNETPYKHNNNTAPQFIITDARDFEKEKARLVAYMRKTQQMGADAFEGRQSHSFGPLKEHEWNNMYYKHLNHHLNQFGV